MAKRPLQGTAIAFGKPCGDAAVLLLAVEVGFVGKDEFAEQGRQRHGDEQRHGQRDKVGDA